MFCIMDYLSVKKTYNHQFDFEIGYLIKSPCKDCETISCFPDCVEKCDTLVQIHTILSDSVSCTRN